MGMTGQVSGNHAVDDPRGTQHAGNPGARMRAGANEEEVRNVLAAHVRPEPRRLPEHWLHREGAAEVTVQFVAEVPRVDSPLGDDVPGQVGKQSLLQVPDEAVSIGIARAVPVDARAQVRHRRQDIPGIAALRRE